MNPLVAELLTQLQEPAQGSLFCPKCQRVLEVHHGARSKQWFAHHPKGAPSDYNGCAMRYGTWGFFLTRGELAQHVVAGHGPKTPSPAAMEFARQMLTNFMGGSSAADKALADVRTMMRKLERLEASLA